MKTRFLTVAACVALLVSCGKEDAPVSVNGPEDGLRTAIVPKAGVSIIAAPESRADLSGVVNGAYFPDSLDKVFAVTAYRGSAAPTSDFSGPYFSNQAVNSDSIPTGSTTGPVLCFASPQYYPANGDKLFFYAYSPVTGGTYTEGTSSVAPKVSWTLTGQQDIMAAQVTTGIGKSSAGTAQGQPNFTFAHKLKQVRFKLVQGRGFADDLSATSISITGCKYKASLDLVSGALSFEDDTTDFSLTGSFPIKKSTDNPQEIEGCILCEAGNSVTIKVVAAGITYPEVTLILQDKSGSPGVSASAPGTSHLVTLTFIGTHIMPSASITQWVEAGEASGDIS